MLSCCYFFVPHCMKTNKVPFSIQRHQCSSRRKRTNVFKFRGSNQGCKLVTSGSYYFLCVWMIWHLSIITFSGNLLFYYFFLFQSNNRIIDHTNKKNFHNMFRYLLLNLLLATLSNAFLPLPAFYPKVQVRWLFPHSKTECYWDAGANQNKILWDWNSSRLI